MVLVSRVPTRLHQNGLKKKKHSRDKKSSGAQYVLMFFVLSLTVGISMGREILATLHFNTDYLFLTLIAIVISLLTAHRHILFVLLMVGISLVVNLPADVLVNFGLDKNILLCTLGVVILEPFLRKIF